MTERLLSECPKCGARGKCDKHGMSASGIDLRRRASDRRYAPAIFARKIGGEAQTWAEHISVWLENGCLSIEVADKHAKVSGLRVIDAIF